MTQLGFGDLLADAESANVRRQLDRETAHLPGTMAEALPFYRAHDRPAPRGHAGRRHREAMRVSEDAHRLAAKLNGGTCGIIAGPDAPGCILESETEAAPGTVPLWGQAGEFTVTVDAMRVRVEITGMFGICSTSCLFPGFYARAVDMDRPFLSETGFRSFLGLYGDPVPGLTPDDFVRAVIAAHVRRELKGRLKAIEARYR